MNNVQDSAPFRVLVVGAGITGASAARTLVDQGFQVTVLERGRAPGGRASTRRNRQDTSIHFDHGATAFSASDEAFKAATDLWVQQGWLGLWSPNACIWDDGELVPAAGATTRFVPLDGMNMLVTQLLLDVPVTLEAEVLGLVARDGQWFARTASQGELGPFEAVVVAAAAGQVARLEGIPEALLQRAVERVELPAFSVMATLPTPLECPWDVVEFGNHAVLGRAVRESAKPGRTGADRWVIQSNSHWAQPRREQEPESLAQPLWDAFAKAVGTTVVPSSLVTHRWGFAHPPRALDSLTLVDAQARLVLAGDWIAGAGVEGAWLSGVAAAGHILAMSGR